MTNHSNPIPARSAVPQNIDELVSAVGEDPDHPPIGKETIIRWAKPDKYAHVFSREASIARGLLQHPLFEVKGLENHTGSSVTWLGAADYSSGPITAIRGSYPVGAVKLQSGCRSNLAHCHVISKEGGK